MTQKAVFIFKDNFNEFYVYSVHYVNPTDALNCLIRALPYSSKIPTFSAGEFACGFIRGNKEYAGGLYLINGFIDDWNYKYEISLSVDKLWVKTTYNDKHNGDVTMFHGNLEHFCDWIDNHFVDGSII